MSPPKRRRGAGKAKGDARSRAVERLLRPVEEVYEEDDGGEHQEGRSSSGSVRPDQIRYYSGVTLTILLEARDSMRFFLFTVQPFPTVLILLENAKTFYVSACQEVYRSKYKGDVASMCVVLCH